VFRRAGALAALVTLLSVLSAPRVDAGQAAAAGLATAAGQATAAGPAPAAGQAAAPPRPGAPTTVCGQSVAPPPAAQLPAAGSGPVLWLLAPCFDAQENVSLVDVQTYMFYIELQKKRSQPSEGAWTPYDDSLEQIIKEDFHRLWNLGFLDNLWIDVADYTFSNGVVGKIVVYNMEERQRVKIVDFTGSKKIDTSKINEELHTKNAEIRLDTFIDPSLLRKVEGVLRDMLKEKGFQNADVTHEIKEVPGGPKLVNVTFTMTEGPVVKIEKLTFVGNKAVSESALKGRMKDNKEKWFLSFISGRGTYQENKFEEDADRVMQYYLDRGYISAQVGSPEIKVLRDSPDKKTRWVELRIPITEGNRYKVGNFDFSGNTVVKTEALRPFFKVTPGEYYSQGDIRKGFQKAQEMYGALGYMDFTGYPDNRPRDAPDPTQPEVPAALEKPKGPPIVDVTMKIQEGKQYFVNRITFVGNNTTRDNVVRRELRLYESGVFNSEALKYSIRRLNQLGYFKPLEGPPKDVNVEKLTGAEGKVDVRMQLTEQNRNQLSFGAGVSQFEGVFGQLSFQTSNFLGRGESLTLSLQAGSRAKNYTLAFTEPFLFDRNITGGLNLFHSEINYINQFTQQSEGGAVTAGFPIGRGFTRMFINYSYQTVRVTNINAAFLTPSIIARNPFLADSLLIGNGGERTISRITPNIVYNTVDQPIFPTTGKRFTLSSDFAGLGGNTSFIKPLAEAVWIIKENNQMSLAIRGQTEYIHAFQGSKSLPISEKLFLGGEYTVRGFDIRSIGPSDPVTGLVLGGNKLLLFNVEQSFHVGGPVRLILFYDAGQVRDEGQPFSWRENITQIIKPPGPILYDPTTLVTLQDSSIANAPLQTLVTGQRSAFKTSTGLEVRFFMPVLNVPFRLIFAENPQRGGVLDNTLQPQKAFQFRFAVGTTF
jgi:outer membrane protein insertion porin family